MPFAHVDLLSSMSDCFQLVECHFLSNLMIEITSRKENHVILPCWSWSLRVSEEVLWLKFYVHELPGRLLDEQCRGAGVCEVGTSSFPVSHGIKSIGAMDSWSFKASKSWKWSLAEKGRSRSHLHPWTMFSQPMRADWSGSAINYCMAVMLL